MVYAQALHALIHALRSPPGTVVPGVETILAVAPHLGREPIPVARHGAQRLAQHCLGTVVPIVGRHIDKVHASLYSRVQRLNGTTLIDSVKHTAQGGGPEAQCRHPHARMSNSAIIHSGDCIWVILQVTSCHS